MDVCDEERGATDTTGTHAGLAWGHVGVACVCADQQAGPRLGRRQAHTRREQNAHPTFAIQDGRAYPVFHQRRVAQFITLCRRSKWSKHWTNSPLLALLATAGSSAACKIISACSNAF